MAGSFSRILLLFAVFHALGSLSFGQEKPCPEFSETLVSCKLFTNEPSRRYYLTEPSRRYYLLIDERDFAPYKLNSIFHYFATKYSDIPEFEVKVFSTIEGLGAERIFDQGMPWISDKEAYDRYFEKITPPHKGYFWAIFERRKDSKVDRTKEYFFYNPDKTSKNFLLTNISDTERVKTPKDRLFYSATYGDMRNISEVIQDVPDVNVKNESGLTPIYYAFSYHHNEIALLLIERGAKTNINLQKGTPLFFVTVGNENYKGLELLLTRGLDLNVRSDVGETALSTAMWNCSYDMIKLLIDNGASAKYLEPEDWTQEYGLLRCKNKKEIEELLLKTLP